MLPPASSITSVPLASSFGPHPFSGASSTSLGGANGPLTYSTVPVIVGQSSAATPPVWSLPTTMITNSPLPPSPASSGVCLSPGLEPVPQKLADRVCSGAYAEMRDLLGDNISLLRELESVNIATTLPALPGTMKPRFREVSSLASWLYCFLAYIALRCPDRETRDSLVYAHLIIKEAQRHGGQGWLAYDKVFRQHAALDPSIQWNVLHPAIQASTLFNPASGENQSPTTSGGSFCSIWITRLPHVLWPICNSHPPQSALSQLVKAANDKQWPPTLCASRGIGEDASFQSRAPSGTFVPAAFSSTQLWSVPVNGSVTHLDHLLQEPAQALGLDSDYLSSCYLNFPLSPSLPPVSHYVHCRGSIA